MNALPVAAALSRAGGEILDELCDGGCEEIFHYTDANGLIGILSQKGELWATDAECMNDTNELKLGNQLLQSAIEFQRTHVAYPLLARLLEHPSYVSGQIFTASFSSQRDLLSQWRAYANNGEGFSLGFRRNGLTELQLGGKDVNMFLVRVDYQPDTQAERARRLVECVLSGLAPLVPQSLSDQDDQFLTAALGLILPTFCATCKNRGFEEEAEHRLVLRSDQDILLPQGERAQMTMPVCSFRSGRYGVTPFVRLRFPSGKLAGALSRIIMGPRVATAHAEQKLRVLLANAGVERWSQVPIDRAVATYR